MTRDETKNILLYVQAYYPNFNVPDKTITVNAWYRVLKEYDYAHVQAGLDSYVRMDTSGFAPTVGEIIENIHSIFGSNDLNELEAWDLVWKAVCNSAYHAEEEFKKLPPLIQKALGSSNQLRNWAIMENIDGKAKTVLQSNFQRTFRLEQEREQAKNKLVLNRAKSIESSVNSKSIINEKDQ